jgi:hypothetical protein
MATTGVAGTTPEISGAHAAMEASSAHAAAMEAAGTHAAATAGERIIRNEACGN